MTLRNSPIRRNEALWHQRAARRSALFFVGSLALACALAESSALAQANGPATATPAVPILDTNWAVGSWIWCSQTHDKQFCRFWRSFEIPADSTVKHAMLRITGDNGFRLMLDGRELGRGSDWRTLTECDVSELLVPGTHLLAVEAFNDRLEAGILFGLRIELVSGQLIQIGSDSSWRIVPETESGWETRKHASPSWAPATVVGAFGAVPWNSMPYGVATLAPFHPISIPLWQRGWFQISTLSVSAIVLLICLWLFLELALQSKAQRLLQRERERIARDLHDDLGSGLTQLVLHGEVAQSELPAASDSRGQVNQLCERARSLARTLDEIVWAINSRRDTLRDFTTYICKFAQSFLQATVIRCRLDVEMDLPAESFDLPIRRNLFLAVKEALNNAAKHSGASELFLRIYRSGDGLHVIVEDNGAGFDPSEAGSERNGLANMSLRMSEIDGECRLSSAPGVGCRVEFRVPRLHVRSRGARLFPWRRRPVISDSTPPNAPGSQSRASRPIKVRIS